jgi:hypothetical protein
MSLLKKLDLFLVSSLMVSVPLAASFAQGGAGAEPWMANYVPAHMVGAKHCPGLTWHISPVEQANQSFNLSGPIWYEDGSGMSFAQGTRQADGNFSLRVKKVSGNGPAGTITGRRMPDGSADATAVGPPCFAGTYHLAPGQTSAQK